MNRCRRNVLLATCFFVAFLPGHALGYDQRRVATDDDGNPVRIAGSVVVVEPDIELSLVTAGGLQEPRREWTQKARRIYPEAVGRLLERNGTDRRPDFDIPDDLPPPSRLGQLLRLNEAVATSIAIYTRPGSTLATKERRLDWTLGPGVEELRKATGADYALFTYVRDSYASDGRNALRMLGFVAGLAMGTVVDIGGGQLVGVATLVDLRTGQVVWFNLLAKQSGDLREPGGADKAVAQLLGGIPL
ncbi:MAG: hypothetical protein KA187_04510 [Arenimonas sp.]|nr:hypothetical protein [Arenimonas sp.]MBP6626660.1 hypothetical protein [Arenimonas sp.]